MNIVKQTPMQFSELEKHLLFGALTLTGLTLEGAAPKQALIEGLTIHKDSLLYLAKRFDRELEQQNGN